jgi:alkyldihydroxyacetonephosphate synthase
MDLKRMAQFVDLDPVSMTVTVEAGMLGKDLEDRLNAAGFTTGHYPQSIFSSTVGGWVAHRGVGTFSTRYGKVDDLVLGLEVVLPDGGVFVTRHVPQSAAGPDLKRLFLGSEGTFGVITRVTLQIYPLPAVRQFAAYSCPTFATGLDVVRRVLQAGYRPAAVRLYDAVEAKARLGTDPASTKALLIVINEGPDELVDATGRAIDGAADGSGLVSLGPGFAETWLAGRFSTAGLVSAIEGPAGIADALEVANVWARLAETYERMKEAMEVVIGRAGVVFGHASHFYHSGANLYMIFEAAAGSDDAVEPLYRAILDAALTACLAMGGTLTHHHGVGIGKRRFMEQELGTTGIDLLRRLRATIDPDGLMNPGKLVEESATR